MDLPELDEEELAASERTVAARLFGTAATIGRYEIRRRLGAGAMGQVYEALDPALGRRVALKVLLDKYAKRYPNAGRRFLREARAMAALSHPNVVEVYDTGTAEGKAFVAMELIDGCTLRQWLAEERATEAICRVFAGAARGLAAAHERRLVHRDFKPDNVMVDAAGIARVLDFGLAAVQAPVMVDDVNLTDPRVVLGTPWYMPPEQLRGESVDARADQFAFCVSLYEALTGERPFRNVRTWVLRRTPRPPGLPTVPRAVQQAVLRGMAPKPEDRWPTMAPIIDALEGRGATRRRPTAFIKGAALGLVALLSVVGTYGAAVYTKEEASPVPAVASAPSECVATAREAVAWSRGRQDAGYFVEALAAAEDAMRMSEACPDASVQGAARAVRGTQLGRLGRLPEATRDLEVAAWLAMGNAQTEAFADAALELVALHGILGDDIERARWWAARAGETLAETRNHRRRRAKLQLYLGTALERVGAYAEARERIQNAIELREKEFGEDHYETAIARCARASITWAEGRNGSARITWTEELGRLERGLGPDHYEVGRIAGRLGMAASGEGRYEDAAAWFARAIAIAERSTGPDGLWVAGLTHNRATVRRALGDFAGAREDLERSARVFEAVQGANAPSMVHAWSSLAEVLRETGDLEGARRLLRRASALAVDALSPDHSLPARLEAQLANVELARDARSDAARHADAAIERLASMSKPDAYTAAFVQWTWAKVSSVGTPGAREAAAKARALLVDDRSPSADVLRAEIDAWGPGSRDPA